jgi:HAD superfamily hydrolase (TIGR01509 family)
LKLTGLKAVIFDMDGLMIDSERLYIDSERAMAALRGKELPESCIEKMMGHKPIESMAIFKEDLSLSESAAELLAERDALMRDKMEHDLVPMPGLFDLLKAVSGRFSLAIATGASRPFLDLTLEGLQIRSLFSALVCADDVSRGKPDPEIYLSAASRLGVLPGECLVLEDSANGIRSASSAGCRTIAVPSFYTKDQDFSLADKICPSLSDVLPLLAKP